MGGGGVEIFLNWYKAEFGSGATIRRVNNWFEKFSTKGGRLIFDNLIYIYWIKLSFETQSFKPKIKKVIKTV